LTSLIDKDALFEKLAYKPHSEYQDSIHRSDARFVIPCCGRRFGKTEAVGHEITYRAFMPESYIWIIGPTYKLGEKEFRVVHNDFVKKLRLPGVKTSYNPKQGDMKIRLPWDTIIEVVSAEKQDSLVGEGLDFACMSEAALHQASTWDQYIEPALSDKKGSAIFPSTPRGNNWYKAMFMLGQEPKNWAIYQSFKFPTWFNKARYPGGLDDPDLKRIRNRVSDFFWAQEYAAEFTARQGKIYKYWDESIHVKDLKYNPFWKNYLAFDFGYSDPFCCYDIQVDQMNNVYVWREYQVRYLSTWEHAQYLKNRENPEGYHITASFADPRGPDEIATLRLSMGLQIAANSVGWALGIEAVDRWMKPQNDGKPKLFVDRSCVELRRQLDNLQTPEGKEGKNAREGQKDYDDHGPDALRYFFNEWEVLGANVSLEDAYSGNYGDSGASGFTTLGTPTRLDRPIGY
jgi:hypothetical protein